MIDTLVVIGSNGMLGNYIKRYFETHTQLQVIGFSRKDFDVSVDPITKLDQILRLRLKIEDSDSDLNQKEQTRLRTLVFNAVGLIPHTLNAKSAELYTKINCQFPLELSLLCKSLGFRMIHPTTDCVYDGLKGKYIETDLHTEQNIYGTSKSQGEPIDCNCTVIRTSIIGEELYNHRSLIEWVKSNIGGKIDGYDNHYWNGITCLQYAKIIEQMIKQNIFWSGVRHIFSPSSVSKYELVQMINSTFKLSIKINKYSTNCMIDRTLDSIYKENNLFNIPELHQQLTELKMFSDILLANPTNNLNNIPNILYLYWDGSPLSYLQYLTVVTFKKYNPGWKVIMYMPMIRFDAKTWLTSEQKTVYHGTNYLKQLFNLDIEIRHIDFETIGFRNDVPEVIKSDYIRYWLLGNYGGMWSDMDIIYLRPVTNLFKSTDIPNGIDTVICYFAEHYPIGMFLSKPNNPFFLNLQRNAMANLDLNAYQSIGSKLVEKLYNYPDDVKKSHPELNILVMSNDSYLPYQWYDIYAIFLHNKPENITPITIGIHWFNGSNISVEYENMLDRRMLPTTGSIYPYIKDYLELLDS